MQTDGAGDVAFELLPHIAGRGFAGYVEVVADGFDPVILYPGIGDSATTPQVPMYLIRPATYANAFALNGFSDDPALGGVYVDAFDCLGDRAPGLSIRTSPPSTVAPDGPWYGYPPDHAQTQTGGDAMCGMALLAPGPQDVTLVRAGTQDVVAKQRVWVRAGTRTWLYLFPFGNTPL